MVQWTTSKFEHKDNISNNKKCVIVIPVYKTKVIDDEALSLKQVVKILGGKYELVLTCPFSLDVTPYNECVEYNFSILRCNDAFFKSQKSYSDLCEQTEFYKAFSEYEFMVIYQLDAWIFEDRLEYFINLDYDYIGAPHLISIKSPLGENGNGGFCLRKIKPFIKCCENVDFTIVPTLQLEDCAFTQRFKSYFNLAPLEICRQFSAQDSPEYIFKKNGNKLPMGCHAYRRFQSNFWRKYIPFSHETIKPNTMPIATSMYGNLPASRLKKNE